MNTQSSMNGTVLEANFDYVGFWMRFISFLIDSILIMIVLTPIFTAMYGTAYWQSTFTPLISHYFGSELTPAVVETSALWDTLLNWVFPAIAVVLFWIYRQATPGKMIFKIKIVDAKTGNVPSVQQFIIRYIGYYVSMFGLFLGFAWIVFNKKKQGWHDLMAGTVVIRDR